MGDYIPIEIESKKKSTVNEELLKRRYSYFNSGKEDSHIRNLEFLTFQGKISFFITSSYKLRVIDPSKNSAGLIEEINTFNSKHTITDSSFRNDGRLCGLSLENDECVALDTVSLNVIRRFKKSNGSFVSISFSSDKSKIIAGTMTGKITIFEISSNDELLSIPAHNDIIKGILPIETEVIKNVELNSNSADTSITYFASCSYDFNIHIWCLSNVKDKLKEVENNPNNSYCRLEIIRTYKHDSPVECIALLTDGKLISCGGTSLKIWDLRRSELGYIHNLEIFGRTITSISTSNDMIAIGCLDRNIYLYDVKTLGFIGSFNHNSTVVKVAISSCSTFIAAALEDGSWNIRKKSTLDLKEDRNGLNGESIKQIDRSYRTGTARYYNRGRRTIAGDQDLEIKIERKHQTKLDKLIRSYSYKKALDVVLGMTWSHFISLINLLSSRGALHLVARENEYKKIVRLLKYISKNIGKSSPLHFILVSELIEHIFHENPDLFSREVNGGKNEVHEYIKKISQKISLEAKQHMMLKEYSSAVNLIIEKCKKNLLMY
ncbi:U3 small nucleolar RNA-associated protein 15 [Cryptosporidium felis]|nr:U3 small nucleolar RNA-associated protein 15 [Cryptosporidium felis]